MKIHNCCFLIPMDPGCVAIGAFYILLNLGKIQQAVSVLCYLVDNDMDDQENIDQTASVTLFYTTQIPFQLAQLVVGVWIVVGATVIRKQCQLRICAVAVVATALLPAAAVAVVFGRYHSREVEYAEIILELGAALYAALVLFSFREKGTTTEELDNEMHHQRPAAV